MKHQQSNAHNHLILRAMRELPVCVALPLYRMHESKSYFKKLHLVSDVLLGSFRLYGHAIIKIAEAENAITDSMEPAIEMLMRKDSHGLWTTTIGKLIVELEKVNATKIAPEFASLFGVQIKSASQPPIKRMTVRYSIIDNKGKKQQVEVNNTPVELLINFRNKYIGHGTVFPEQECKEIFSTYEPVLEEMLSSLMECSAFQFTSATDGSNIHGYDKICNEAIILHFNGAKYAIESPVFITSNNNEHNPSLTHKQNTEIWDTADQNIIKTYPYFLALPYKKALEEEDSFKRLHLLKEVFLNYLKYLGLVTASEYFGSDLKIGAINNAFKSFLFRPQLGHWNAFLRNAIQALEEQKHQWFVKELPSYYNETEISVYASGGETAIGKLIEFRNRTLGHGTVPTDNECQALWVVNFGLLKELLVRLDFCKKYTLVSNDKTTTWRLMGTEITSVNSRNIMKSNVAILNAANQELSIVPFYIMPGSYFVKEVADKAKLMVYDQNTGNRIVFFSPENIYGETNNTIVLDQLHLLLREKEKQDPVSLDAIDSDFWQQLIKNNNEATLNTLWAEKKIIRGIYQERQDAEIALRSWIGARAGLFFLAAEAGSGKTNLLVEMMRQYAERGIDTILLRGNRFRTADIWQELCYRLNLNLDCNIKSGLFFKYDQQNPLMILIDGANEHPDAQQLFQSILHFLDEHKGGNIKIVLSWRVNVKSELPQAEDKYEVIVYNDAKENNREENVIARSAYWLKPLNKLEIEGAWNMYVTDKQSKTCRKPRFTFEELTYHDRALSEQLDNPLLLRLFLELSNGKKLPKHKERYVSIWNLYHEKLIAQ
jgi:hypothetical protein